MTNNPVGLHGVAHGVGAHSRAPLPVGWEWRRLGEIAPASADQISPTKFPAREFRYLSLDSLPSGGWVEPEPYQVKGTEVRSNCIQFDTCHVLYAKLRPYLNKVVVPTHTGIATTEFVPLVPNQDGITREYLAWYLRSPQFVEYAIRNSSGARMPRVRMADFWNASIPVAPLAEQRRIVAHIEAAFARIVEARRLLESIAQETESLLEAALIETFIEIEGQFIPQKNLNEITHITSGGTPSRDNPEYYRGNIPWVKTGELNDGFITETEEHITSAAIENSSAKLFPVGTLLIALYGQGQTRGRTGILSIQAATNQACCALLPAIDEFDPRYLQFWFRRKYKDLRQQSEMRGGNQPNLNAMIIKALKPPLPSLREQQRIVAYLDSVQAQVAALRGAQAVAAAELAGLEASILARGFRGEL